MKNFKNTKKWDELIAQYLELFRIMNTMNSHMLLNSTFSGVYHIYFTYLCLKADRTPYHITPTSSHGQDFAYFYFCQEENLNFGKQYYSPPLYLLS